MNKQGFVALPFLVLFAFSLTLCTYLCHKAIVEITILESMKLVNQQIQNEAKVVEQVHCLIQCENLNGQTIELSDDSWAIFEETFCLVNCVDFSLCIDFDPIEKRILRVSYE